MIRPIALTIGELSRRTGCSVETIRYYERIELLPPPPRTAAGYRLYGGAHEERLRFVRRARELGFSLGEVRALLRLAEGGDRACAEGLKSKVPREIGGVQEKILCNGKCHRK